MLLALLLLIYGVVIGTSGVDWMSGVDVADAIFSLTGFVGLCGYAYARRVGSARFWRAWAPAQVAWDLFFILVATPLGWAGELPDSEPESGGESLSTIALSLTLLAPLWLALFRYGYRSQALWDRATPSA